jgi:hypothetical protein
VRPLGPARTERNPPVGPLALSHCSPFPRARTGTEQNLLPPLPWAVAWPGPPVPTPSALGSALDVTGGVNAPGRTYHDATARTGGRAGGARPPTRNNSLLAGWHGTGVHGTRHTARTRGASPHACRAGRGLFITSLAGTPAVHGGRGGTCMNACRRFRHDVDGWPATLRQHQQGWQADRQC